MANTSKTDDLKRKAQQSFAKGEQRQREADMRVHEQVQYEKALHNKTARLKALRLAKEAEAEAAAAEIKAQTPVPAPKKKRVVKVAVGKAVLEKAAVEKA